MSEEQRKANSPSLPILMVGRKSDSETALAGSPGLSPSLRDGELFPNIWSSDFLGFSFNDRAYGWQLESARMSSAKTSAISCRLRQINGIDVVWMVHTFDFIGGSLGCAEGELLCRGFEKATELGCPVVVVAKSGGARMQEGTLALMQMAKVSVAVQKFRALARLPYISVCLDPTFGGTTASYAMQGDIRIAVRNARIGFAGENVILNTIFKMDQAAYDRECPPGFQTAPYVLQHGQIDLLVDSDEELEHSIGQILSILSHRNNRFSSNSEPNTPSASHSSEESSISPAIHVMPQPIQPILNVKPEGYLADYTRARRPDRIQPQDVVLKLFPDFVELAGDGKVGYDRCIRGGFALLDGVACIVLATYKGHDPNSMKDANFGMAEPAGYRMANRLFGLAEHFGIPVVTLVDTPGAYPSFHSEKTGQPEAIATNLLTMSGLKVPIVTVFIGEGGSGGALALAVGDKIGMLSDGYFGVITPEGAASILVRYPNEQTKAKQFPNDCRLVAAAQHIYAEDLLKLGVIDHIIWETPGETYNSCDHTMQLIQQFIVNSLKEISLLSPIELVERRHAKFRTMGQFSRGPPRSPSPLGPQSSRAAANRGSAATQKLSANVTGLLHYFASTVVNGPYSALWVPVPADVAPISRIVVDPKELEVSRSDQNTAKWILDHDGPDGLVSWMKKQTRVLITDTSMRDAHQSILATRVRTADLLCVAEESSAKLSKAFSLEVWGGATFDVCMRFLHECPWKRLRMLRSKIPNVCLQMLLRGSNAVGYKNYPDNVIERFVQLAAKNGVDIFRIFDCFNDVNQMHRAISAVRAAGKVAEVCMAFSGNFLSPKEKIYTLEYYSSLAKKIAASGAHILAIKDMAGIFRPQMAAPFMAAIRAVTDLPVHFHTHNTSGAALSTVIEMTRNGCSVVDAAIASMSDTTSQPSLNAFLAAMEGDVRDPGIPWLSLEKLDTTWGSIRSQYYPNESGMRSGTARVYDHQIPGGQYSNLIAQCKSLGLWQRWSEVLDTYREVNTLFGDIIKVTPSSKVVGDMALYLVSNNLKVQDVMERGHEIDFPQSVVSLFKGQLGKPHHGMPEFLTNLVLKGEKPLEGRPGDSLPPVDFDAERMTLEKAISRPVSDEEVISYLLYPKEFVDYAKFLASNGGDLLAALPTFYFAFGSRIGASFKVVPFEDQPITDSVEITLARVGPLSNENMRTIVFHIERNGQPMLRHEIKIKESRHSNDDSSNALTVLADPSDKTQIPSPLPGVVDKVYVSPGDIVAKGQLLLSVAAMKMEVQVNAPFNGVVERLCVQAGSKVDNKTLVAQIKEVPSK